MSNSNFQTAIRRLNVILQQNRVKREWQRDRFFTKPAALRYQLRSQRHRRRFAAMVSQPMMLQIRRRRTNSDIFLIGSKKGSDRSGYQAERHVNELVIFFLISTS